MKSPRPGHPVALGADAERLGIKSGAPLGRMFGLIFLWINGLPFATLPVATEAPGTQEPTARLISETASARPGAAVRINVVRAGQAHDAGGKARAFSAMIKALADAKAAGIDPGRCCTCWITND